MIIFVIFTIDFQRILLRLDISFQIADHVTRTYNLLGFTFDILFRSGESPHAYIPQRPFSFLSLNYIHCYYMHHTCIIICYFSLYTYISTYIRHTNSTTLPGGS